MTIWVPPPSPLGYCLVTGPHDHVTGHMMARPSSLLHQLSPAPRLAVYGGRGVSAGPPYVTTWEQSLWSRIGYKGPLPTHKHKLHTQVLGTIPGRGHTCRYNPRCSRSSKPYAGVFGGVLLPWGKGLSYKPFKHFWGHMALCHGSKG